jgi:hypothetical protein
MSVAPLLQLEAALLRRQMPDLLLKPGMTLMARVSERQGRHGIIVLAGTPLVAQLPDEVQAGDKLRLMVEDTRGERVTMKLVNEQPTAPPHTPVIGLPMPDGTQARFSVEEREEGGGESGDDPEHASIAISYVAPALGNVGLRLKLVPGGVIVEATLAAGRPVDLAEDAAGELRARLSAATGRQAEVTVVPRREPLDLYA